PGCSRISSSCFDFQCRTFALCCRWRMLNSPKHILMNWYIYIYIYIYFITGTSFFIPIFFSCFLF
ncbi:MAG: hypothetical protein N7Q72_04055, partial [Spiroplasma sp. Tabriz.8]|nr:hypothetical protein [Spiroplasma sp. Tabriz.8]